ncbi:DUF461 domain-containing protein [Streptomyces sp. ISL-98]|uniref:DUF461 domain-containing protein n=1 Tax=Streptomyces sp. ISL-98 TaxID=2819192 RepID=UPI001BEC9384|nr:DUF461 domain-containing protein [Streptomyces sp. ISL-98]MBT2510913.1 DUF461 domain-containing protein [Streptomyces sp. ISL-98]
MSRSLRRGALAATAIVFSIASLAACGAGNDAQSLGVKPDNAATSVDNIKIQNAAIVTQPKLDAEGPAVVTAKLFNNGTKAETLESIKLPGTDVPVKLKPAKGSGPVTVPAGGSLLLGGEGNASAVIEKGREAARDGDAQPVVFELSSTGSVELRAFVTPATHYFKGFGPSEAPKPPAATPTGSATATPSGTPTGTPTEPPAGGEGHSASSTPTEGSAEEHDAGTGH